MMDPLAQMVMGYQPVMPTYRGRLSPPETAAIVEYIKSLRSDRIDTQSTQGPSYELRRAQ
jgi:cytochrome c oxidase subunit 2